MARFHDYDSDKGFWFLMYLQIAELVSKYPSLSAKKSDIIKEEVEDYLLHLYQRRGRGYNGFFNQK